MRTKPSFAALPFAAWRLAPRFRSWRLAPRFRLPPSPLSATPREAMCECLGTKQNGVPCVGCESWREKYHHPVGQKCGENIAKTARRAGAALCAYCWEGRAPGEPVPLANGGMGSPRSQASAHSGRSTPVQNPQLNAPPPPPQLHDICARMEAMLARMEGVLGLMVSQSQAAAMAANAPPPPPGIAVQRSPQAAAMEVDSEIRQGCRPGPGPLAAPPGMSSRGGPGPLAAPRVSEPEPLREPGSIAAELGPFDGWQGTQRQSPSLGSSDESSQFVDAETGQPIIFKGTPRRLQ